MESNKQNGTTFQSSGLRQKVDQLMDILYSGGVNNPMDSIEQLSYLIFLRLLTEKDEMLAALDSLIKTPMYPNAMIRNTPEYGEAAG